MEYLANHPNEVMFLLTAGALLLVAVGIVLYALLEEAAGPARRWWNRTHGAFADAEQSRPVRKCAERMASRRRAQRIEAAHILGVLNDPTAVPALVKAIERYDEDVRFLEVAVQSLTQLGDPRALPALRRLTADYPYSLMKSARQAIALIEPRAELLRASASPMQPATTLLRPVSPSTPSVEAVTLLRAHHTDSLTPAPSDSQI